MAFDIFDKSDFDIDSSQMWIKRRKALLSLISQEFPNKEGKIVLFAPHQPEHGTFIQESSFYYFSGISEASLVLTMDDLQEVTLYAPNFGNIRALWLDSVNDLSQDTMGSYGIDQFKGLGQLVKGYQICPYFSAEDYEHVIQMLQDMVSKKLTIFTMYPADKQQYASVKQIVDRLEQFVPGLKESIVDISRLVAQLRRKKDTFEVEQMYRALEITGAAFQAATHVLKPGISEAEIHAAMEYIYIENGAKNAYPTIVAGGKRATILHYHTNQQQLTNKDVLLIDSGAMHNHYCADITRVFPVSGKFSKRQKELYEIVLETQMHVVEHVRPGVWINNPDEQDASLQHIAMKFLEKQGYEKYFMHGIGHFLGLDAHDVGDRNIPLQEGDVITVEPGIYIPEESIGIRIEDNYWVVKDLPPVCLSESIPKSVKDVENMVEESF